MTLSRGTAPTSIKTAQKEDIASSPLSWRMNASKNGTTNLVYIGYAQPGTSDSDNNWLIMENTYDTSGNVVMRKHANNSLAHVVFDQIWDDSSALTITAITKAADAEVTTSAAHGYSTGDKIEIISSDMTEVNSDGYGSIVFTITKVDATKFTLGVNSSGYVGVGTSGSSYKRDYLNLTYA